MPSAFAVLRLTTSSNFTVCWTGKSPGFSPLTMIGRQLEQRRAVRLARPKTPRTWRPQRPRLNIFAQHEILRAAFPRPQPPAEDIPIYNGRGCTLLELSQGKCRWPISNPGAEDFCFCGNEPVKGLPYCLGHARIAYRSVGRQRSSRRETR